MSSVQTQQQIREKIVRLMSQWKPIPRELSSQLEPKAMAKLAAVLKKMRALGLANKHYLPSERLKIFQALLEGRQPPGVDASEEGVVNAQPEKLRRHIRANEAMNVKRSDAQTIVAQKKELATHGKAR